MFLKGVLKEIETIEQMVRFPNFNRGRGVHFGDWIFELNGLVSCPASIALIAASPVLPARWARSFHVSVGQESAASILKDFVVLFGCFSLKETATFQRLEIRLNHLFMFGIRCSVEQGTTILRSTRIKMG